MIIISKDEINNCSAFVVMQNNEVIGYARFEQTNSTKIFEVKCEEEFFDGLIRAVINYSALNGIEKIEISNDVDNTLIKKYNFDKITTASDFLNNYKNCKKNKC
jgi:hypothetical protein